ncbi:MAG TPA: hypothetical protein EYQ25_11235 [Planctomycetes bacterium]|nr:hypothetical protein [Planctomycetota bacterium]HIL35966.1 hypothetical protein [Planctomycetota bacterium]
MNAHRISLVSLFAAALFATSCQPLPERHGMAVEITPVTGRLATINPNDVVVAPIEFAEEGLQAPEQMLRQAAVGSLIARRYAPLSLDFVDASIPESLAGGVLKAPYRPGSLGEDAVLRIIVHSWDTSLWNLRNALMVDLEFIMEDPGDSGQELWHARLKQRFDFEKQARTAATESALLSTAMRVMTDEICSQLPQRVVLPGAH